MEVSSRPVESGKRRLSSPHDPLNGYTGVNIDKGFDDAEGLLDFIESDAPYSLIYTKEGYDRVGGAEPWFRKYWYSDGEWLVPEAQKWMHSPHLIEASKQAFNATVVRPSAMLLNITCPMQAGRPHWDIPNYRGIPEQAPLWFRMIVHNSRLFVPYVAPEVTGLVWFYRGIEGGFEYWPDGPLNPSAQHRSPMWNSGLVTDNAFTFHRPMAIGPLEQRIMPGQMSGHSKLHSLGNSRWQMRDEHGSATATYEAGMVRILILWKALAFADQAAVQQYDAHSDDLSYDIVWSTFAHDLAKRGVDLKIPADPMKDKELRRRLHDAYPNPGLKYFSEAGR